MSMSIRDVLAALRKPALARLARTRGLRPGTVDDMLDGLEQSYRDDVASALNDMRREDLVAVLAGNWSDDEARAAVYHLPNVRAYSKESLLDIALRATTLPGMPAEFVRYRDDEGHGGDDREDCGDDEDDGGEDSDGGTWDAASAGPQTDSDLQHREGQGGPGDLPRGFRLRLPDPSGSPEPPAAYRHQLETLRRLEHGATAIPPVSGIVHLPTGAGKTRVALEFIARRLHEEPAHRFIWATDARELIRQTMSKTFEFARRFPGGTKIAWYDGDDSLLDEDVHLLFVTRSQLRTVLEDAHTSRSSHPWRVRASSGTPTTLIYDECHQLGAEGLQHELWKFYDKVLAFRTGAHRWRVVGLSATPVPTREDAHPLLQGAIFPLRREQPSFDTAWGMHVFHRVTNNALIADGVLCPVNMKVDSSGIFDIPQELLRRVAQDGSVRPPGPDARKDEVMKYAVKFNKSVMSDQRIIRFLAERLARNLPTLGKTIVFSPTIDAANRLVAELNTLPGMSGRVAGVHSRMTEAPYSVPGQSTYTPSAVLDRFRNRRSEPCILVNVEMLTEGFDDPLVHCVVLAKLTLSTNRFWQMIGRGTRGRRANGTSDCYVIDPIKLVRLYDYFKGYQPSVNSRPGQAIEDEEEERGAGALDPSVPTVSRAPLPSAVPYKVSAELAALHSSVAVAIDAFLRGGRLNEQDAVDLSRQVQIAVEDGGVVVRSGSGSVTADTGPMLILETIARMRQSMGAELDWLELQVPPDMPEEVLRYWMRKLRAIEQLGLRTLADYARAEMDGRLAAFLSTPVVGPVSPPAVAAPVPVRPFAVAPPLVIAPGTMAADVATLCMAVARADGVLDASEVEVAARIVVAGAGVPACPELGDYLRSVIPSSDECVAATARLAGALEVPDRKRLVRDLVFVAEADKIIHRNEVQVIMRSAAALGGLEGYAEGLLDARA